MSIRVVLVDDEAMVRVGLRMVLTAEPDIEVVGEAEDGAAAESVVAETRPDVVLMDIRMPNVDGIEGARRVLASSPEVRVVVLTTFDEDAYVEAALRRCARWLATVPNCSMTRNVTEGSSNPPPRATVRTASMSRSGGATFSRKPLTPSRSAAST